MKRSYFPILLKTTRAEVHLPQPLSLRQHSKKSKEHLCFPSEQALARSNLFCEKDFGGKVTLQA